jgi:hypothetical protein
MTKYLKMGRLLPGENGMIQVMRDGFGEIGTVNQADMILTLSGLEPSGDIELSSSGKSVRIWVNGVMFVAIARQVRRMIREWPRRKAGLWGMVE